MTDTAPPIPTGIRSSVDRQWVPAWLINPAGLLIVIATIYALFSLSLRLLDLGRPYGSYIAFSEPGASWAKILSDTPDWWATSDLHPDPLGLRLIRIDGLPYSANARDQFRRAAAEGRTTVTIDAEYNGQPLSLTLPIRTFTWQDMIDISLPNLITALVFLLLAVEVLRARATQPLNQAFAVIASLIAIHRLGSPLAIFSDGRLPIEIGLTGPLVASAFIGAATYRLAVLFPTPLKRPMRLVRPYFVISALTAAAMIIIRLLWPPFLDNDLRVPLIIGSVFVAVLLYFSSVIALLTRLVWSWINERETRRERLAAAIVAFGVTMASPVLIVIASSATPALSELTSFFFRGLDLRYLFPAIPLAFAYVIVRFQTFRTPSPLFMFVVVMSLSALTAAIAAWLWLLAQPADSGPLRPPFAGLFMIIFATAGFWSLVASRKGWFGRFLNWEHSSYDAARTFGRRVMGTAGADLTEMPQTIARALVDDLQLERAAVWLWRPDGAAEDEAAANRGTLELVGRAGAAATDWAAMQPTDSPVLLRLLSQAAPRRIGDDETTPPALRPIARAGIEAIVPLESGGVPLGLLGLGKRWDEAIFDDRDLAIAELVGQQATLFLLAAQQVEQLRRVPAQITEAQERERLSLARELHDTTQQFLGRLPFYLAISKSKIAKEPTEAIEMLDRSMDEAGAAAAELRRIRVNLAPNMLETSLRRPLQDLVSHVRHRSALPVELSAPADLDAATTLETRHALYRVIQQALDNAVTHAAADHIAVDISRDDSRISFSVADDGRGMARDAVQAAAARGSFGLRSMRTRLESVGGGFELESEEGHGTTISGWVPAAID